MSAGVPPKKGAAYTFSIGLIDQSNSLLLKIDPTIAAHDFKVSIDGGALADPATLPAVSPAGSAQVIVSLSAAEMNGDDIALQCHDVAGSEWADQFIHIKTSAAQIGDVAALDANAQARLAAWIKNIAGI